MGRHDVISKTELVHMIVIDEYQGKATIGQILASKHFREGYDESQIYRYVAQLRKIAKGIIGKAGTEAWEVIDSTVYGLEYLLTQEMRRKISLRRRALEKGIASASIKDNLIFDAKIQANSVNHKKQIGAVLDSSTTSLEVVGETAHLVKRTLTDLEGDFRKE